MILNDLVHEMDKTRLTTMAAVSMLDMNENSRGWDYDTYLQVFLLIEESDTICRRMTHVIEKNIRLMSGYEGFRMKNCVYGILVKYTCDFKSFGIHEVQTALSY